MFSRNKDDTITTNTSASETKSTTKNSTKRSARAAPSIFSSDLQIEGTLHSEGDIQIDGRVEGDIRSGSLTIGEKAVVNGEIIANEITIRGRVIGGVRGRRVQLASSAHVEGDILHNALAVETGAFFDGNCRHAEDPLTAEMPRNTRAEPPTNVTGQMRVKPVATGLPMGVRSDSSRP